MRGTFPDRIKRACLIKTEEQTVTAHPRGEREPRKEQHQKCIFTGGACPNLIELLRRVHRETWCKSDQHGAYVTRVLTKLRNWRVFFIIILNI